MTTLRDDEETRVLAPAGAAADDAAETQVIRPVPDEAELEPAEPDGPPPRRADDIDLLGLYEGSGFKDPPYLVRRADGQVIQLPPLLYALVEEIDGRRGYAELADAVSARVGRGLGAGDVRLLVEEKLRPLGVLAQADGSSPALPKADPMLALKLRTAVIPERAVQAVARVFRPLFLPPVVLAVLGGLVALDVWLFGHHGVAQSTRAVLYQPAYLLLLLGLVALSAAFHECGHATACAYGGAKPGVMGAGLYLVWPAFYTDVTDAYRLGRGGRLRTDLGGVYFNVIFTLATAGAYFATGFEPLLLVIPLQHLEIAHQFLPFLRLDGYYIVSDLTGVPDMFSRIRPTLASLLPWRPTDPRVGELKPWARAVVTLYVFLVVPFLLFALALMVLAAPRIFATAWASGRDQWHAAGAAFHGHGGVLAGLGHGVELLVLALPTAGIVLTFWRLGTRLSGGLWRRGPVGRAVLVAGGAAAALYAGYAWWPSRDYTPIRPNERGTLASGVVALGHELSGRRPLPPPPAPAGAPASTGDHRGPAKAPRRVHTPALTRPATTAAATTPAPPAATTDAGAATTTGVVSTTSSYDGATTQGASQSPPPAATTAATAGAGATPADATRTAPDTAAATTAPAETSPAAATTESTATTETAPTAPAAATTPAATTTTAETTTTAATTIGTTTATPTTTTAAAVAPTTTDTTTTATTTETTTTTTTP